VPAALHALSALCSTIYGGTVVAFALLLAIYPRATDRPASEVARVYRSAGPILGLSMGGWVLGLIAGRYLTTGTLSWAWSTPVERLDLATWLSFAVLWVSSFVLEIWTMEPLRAAVGADGTITDPPRFHDCYRATSRHLGANAGLVVLWTVLGSLAAPT
jgi:hypothetical protein